MALERDEFQRAAWRVMVATEIEARKFVFIDEMGANTLLSVVYGWAKKGERAWWLVPRKAGSEYHAALFYDHRGGDLLWR